MESSIKRLLENKKKSSDELSLHLKILKRETKLNLK